ncbi:FAD binding domain-containing protein [Wukongibacter baidiensis]|uniref:FAD binding domain-containing protein n=1 Tax=Wukongibacter baidiensis TaxID=1723361 RepID=UPI003D7FAB2A
MGIEKVHKVFDVNNALQLLEKHRDKAEVLAGGTDLLVHIREDKNKGNIIIDISDIREMKKIEILENEIILGALTTFSEIVQNEYIKEKMPGLWKAAKSVGSPQIRNMGTIGGNICNASPAADGVPPLLALDAILSIKCNQEARTLKLSEFYQGRGKTALRANEMLVSVRIPILKDKKINIGFEKLGPRNALAISKISSSVYMEIEGKLIKDIRIASGALGGYPLRERSVEEFMKGKELCDKIIEEAAMKYSETLSQRLAGRSSLEYKREAVKGVFKKAVYNAVNG